jgi:hypothetical protein
MGIQSVRAVSKKIRIVERLSRHIDGDSTQDFDR